MSPTFAVDVAVREEGAAAGAGISPSKMLTAVSTFPPALARASRALDSSKPMAVSCEISLLDMVEEQVDDKKLGLGSLVFCHGVDLEGCESSKRDLKSRIFKTGLEKSFVLSEGDATMTDVATSLTPLSIIHPHHLNRIATLICLNCSSCAIPTKILPSI